MAKALLEWETRDAAQLDDLLAGKPPRPPKAVATTTVPTGGPTAGDSAAGAAAPATPAV
jgi:cell division protease FtsH